MLTVAEAMIHIRLDSPTKQKVERLAKASGLSLTEYVARLIQAQYNAVSEDELELLEQLQGKLASPRVLTNSHESQTAKKNRRRAARHPQRLL